MARRFSGGSSTGLSHLTRVVSGSGEVLSLSRKLGASSTIALRSGSNANLSLQNSGIWAQSALADGVRQNALIRESLGSGADLKALEYTVTLVGEASSQEHEAPSSEERLPEASQLAGAYGLALLVEGYTGPALRVRRTSDGGEQDIGFVDQALDVAAALAFKGSADLTVVRVYDQSGQQRDLTQPQVGAQPDLWLGEGGPTITNYTGDKPLLIPPQVSIERNNCSIFMATRTPGQAATCGYWGFGKTTLQYGLTSPRTSGSQSMQPVVSGSSLSLSPSDRQVVGVANMSVIGVVSNSSGQEVWRDEHHVTYPATSAALLNQGGEVGEAIVYDGRTDWRAFVVYAQASTATQTAQVRSTLRHHFGAMTAPHLAFLFGGDSIIFGTGGSHNRTISAALHHRVDPDGVIRNVGIAGHQLQDHYRDFDTSSGANLTLQVPNIYVGNYGHNDIKLLVTNAESVATVVATMKSQLRHMSAKLRAFGFDMVIWQEAFADMVFTPEQEAARQQWNSWLHSGALADDGLPCVDAVDSVASDASFVLSDAETTAGAGWHWP